uniref:CS domain-containing protein n=1 Tax=Picea sitchensis TaxID=3332 RepID=D5ABR2_PICSI|nr:unknown [Picea sitchensis]
MSRHPEVKWAQRSDKLYITIELPDANNPKWKLEPDGKFTFSATTGQEKTFYELDFYLYDRVNVEESKISVNLRNIICILKKEDKKWWKQLLKTEAKRLPFLKVDWDKWVDEDEEKDDKLPPVGQDMDFGGMDFSKLGMGDADDEPFNDDELDVNDDEFDINDEHDIDADDECSPAEDAHVVEESVGESKKEAHIKEAESDEGKAVKM